MTWWVLWVGLLAAGGTVPADLHTAMLRERVVTPLDYFENGRRAVDDYLADDARRLRSSHLSEVLGRAKRLCARVELRSPIDGSSYHTVMSSGVLLDGGRRVLTAGHSFAGASGGEIEITFSSGEVHRARLIAHRYRVEDGGVEDWALLEVDGPPRASVPEIDLGHAAADSLVFVLGYPEHIGIDSRGKVVFGSERRGAYLEPLVTVGAVESTTPLMLRPRVGSVPTKGMSGGPVFDRDGRLLGIFLSIVRRGSQETYTYRIGTASPVLRDHLANLPR